MPDPIIFVDLGAHKGESTRAHEKRVDIAHAYLWECHPMTVIEPPECTHTTIRAAAHTADEPVTLYLGNDHGSTQGTTTIKGKKTGCIDTDNPVAVHGIDLVQWLLAADDAHREPIVVKMNVEGAEYGLIPTMSDNGALSYIDELHISLHGSKVSKTDSDDENIRDLLRKSGFAPYFSPFEGCEGWKR